MGNWNVAVGSDVYAGPVGEEGERGEELCFYVTIEVASGARYRSRRTWTTEEYGHNHNGVASGLAARYAAKVEGALARGATPVGSPKWIVGRPVYGSAAYDPRVELEDEARDLDIEAGPAEGDRFRRAAGLVR